MRNSCTVFASMVSGRWWLAVFLLLLFAACSGPAVPGAPGDDQQQLPPSSGAITHTVRVLLDPSDRTGQIEAAYGGTVLVWHDYDTAGSGSGLQPFAVVAVSLNGSVEQLGRGGLEPCPEEALIAVPVACIEENERSLIAGAERLTPESTDHLSQVDNEGRSTIWNEGSWIADEGRSTIWNEGEFSWQPENTDLWSRLQLELAHNATLAGNLGRGVLVAVIDTGVDLQHPQLRTHLAPEELWLDVVDGDLIPQEEGDFESSPAYGHGTNVAGIIRQVAPEAQILPIRVLGPDGGGYVADLIVAIEHAITAGADIINLSLGSARRSEALSSVVARAAERGVFVVMAAGNSGREVTFPASESREANRPGHALRLTVTSVDDKDIRSDFAAYGFPVGLAAPGEGVWGPAPELHTAAWTGTSMTAPMAAGALALALGESGRLSATRTDLIDRLSITGADPYELEANRPYQVWQQLGSSRLDYWRFLDDVLDAH